MTVVGLKLSRRANAVSSLHGEVSRAMWTGLYPGRNEDAGPHRPHHQRRARAVAGWRRRCRAFTTGICGAGWQTRSGEPRIWEGIENVDDGELWETHLSLKSASAGFRAPPRRGAIRAPARSPRNPSSASAAC